MKDLEPLPDLGDRVRLYGRDEIYVVVEVNEETQSVSLLPESEIERVPIDNLIPIDSSRRKAEGNGASRGSPTDDR